MAKDTFYFSHDYNSRNDDKIKRLIRKHGMLGYGIWWAIVEDLYNNANALQLDCEGIAYDLHTNENVIESVIRDFDLFKIEGNIFGSCSIEKRLDERNAKSEKARQNAFTRWNKDENNANALPPHSESNAIKESIVKKNKGKKLNIIYYDFEFLNLIKPNIKISINEYEKLCNEFTEEITHKAIIHFSNWKIEKGKESKSDYLTIRRWVIDAVTKQGQPKSTYQQGTQREPTYGGQTLTEIEKLNKLI